MVIATPLTQNNPIQHIEPIPIQTAVGAVYPVTIVIRKQGNESGVILNNQFIPAHIPEGLTDNAKLLVRVAEISPTLILKILDSLSQDSETYKNQTKNLITAQLPQNIESAIRNSINLNLDLPFLNETSVTAKNSQNIFDSIKNILFKNSGIINEESFDTGKSLYKAIIQTLSQNIPLTEIKTLNDQLNRNKLGSEQRLNLKDFLEVAIKLASGVEQNGEPLELPTSTNNLLQRLGLPVSLRLAVINSKEVLNISLKEGLTIFEDLVRTWIPQLNDQNQEEAHIKKTLREFEQFSKLVKQLDNKMISTKLGDLVTNLINKFPSEKLQHDEKAHSVASRLLNALDNLQTTKDTLSTINNLALNSGDIGFFIIPLLMNGALGRFQLSVSSEQFNKRESQESSSQIPFQIINLSIPMPSLGEISADIAFRPGEALINIASKSEDVIKLIHENLEKLRLTISKIGYTKLEINTAATKTNQNILPEWITNTINGWEVVA